MPRETPVRAPATSFIVRIWNDDEGGHMRGEVEYIGTGEKRLFLQPWSLLTLLENWRADIEHAG